MRTGARFGATALAAALLLALAACAPVPPESVAVQPPQPVAAADGQGDAEPGGTLPAPDAGGELFLLRGTEDLVLDGDGNAAVRGQDLSLLYDVLTGLPQAIVQTRNGPTGEDEAPRVFSRLYDTTGGLLADWEEIQYSGGMGGWVVAANGSPGDMWYSEQAYSGWLYNIYSGEALYESVYFLHKLDDTRVVLKNRGGWIMALLEPDGTAIYSFPTEADYHDLTVWKDYVLATTYGGSGYSVALLDSEYRPISTSASMINPLGEYLLLRGDGDGCDVLRMPDTEPLLRLESGSVQYYDGTNAVIYNDATTLCAADGTPLTGPLPYIEPVEGTDGTRFLSYDEITASLMLMDSSGVIVKTLYWPGSGWVSSPLPGYITAPKQADDDDWMKQRSALLDSALNVIIPAEEYQELYHWEGMRGDTLVGTRVLDATLYTTRYDILDTGGNVLISGLTSIDGYTETRLLVTRGFSTGLMDYDGNWIYKQSAFTGLEDE